VKILKPKNNNQRRENMSNNLNTEKVGLMEKTLWNRAARALALVAGVFSVGQAYGAMTMPQAVNVACADALEFGGPDKEWTCQVLSKSRTELPNDIILYRMSVKVGANANDVISLYRVTTETETNVPSSTDDSVLMVHGDIWGFDGAFLSHGRPISSISRKTSVVAELVDRGIDVWGIDLRWVGVPITTTDFTFMENWGYASHTKDIDLSLALARHIRSRTGSTLGKMHLLGWSSGAGLAYAYANLETSFSAQQKQIRGLIPVDLPYKVDPADTTLHDFVCQDQINLEQLISAGVYFSDFGSLIQQMGALALTQPDDPSDVVPGLTNKQAALLLGGATYQFIPLGDTYHFVAAQFDENSIPFDLTYQTPRKFFKFFTSASPYQSLREVLDIDKINCGNEITLYDNHLNEISVPVYYIGAEGGFGSSGLYTLDFLGSTDKTSNVISLQPDPAIDFGHADLWLSSRAKSLVWAPLAQWIKSR
jgi:pimeloyl-ACP methyl ester carboxylesterase